MGSTPVAIWNPASRLDPLFDPEDATLLDVNLQGASATVPLVIPPGMILGEVTAVPGLYGVYNPANSDGTNTARMINAYKASVVGAAATVGTITSYGGEWPGITWPALPAYKSGDFDFSKIVGLESAGVTSMFARIIEGALGTIESDSIAIQGATSGTWGLTIPSITVNATVYPALVIANTGIVWNITAAALATQVNAALLALGIPGYLVGVSGTGGASPVVVTYHGVYANRSLVITTDGTQLGTVATAVVTRTAGTANTGVIRFG